MIYEVGVEIEVQGKRVVPIKTLRCLEGSTECAFFHEDSCPLCGSYMFIRSHDFAAYLIKQLVKEVT